MIILLPLGIGIAIGLFCGPGWGFYAILGALLVSVFAIFKDIKSWNEFKESILKQKKILLLGSLFSFFVNVVIISLIAFLILLFRFNKANFGF